MNNPVPGFNDSSERKASLLKSLSDFTKEHRAAHWAGTSPASWSRSSHTTRAAFPHQPPVHLGHDALRRLRWQPGSLPIVNCSTTLRDQRHDRASRRLLQGRRLRLRSWQTPAPAARPPSGGKSSMVILLKRGWRSTATPTPGPCTVSTAAGARSPLHLVPTPCAGSSARATASTSRASSAPTACRACRAIQRRLHADAGAAHLHLRGRPRRSAPTPARSHHRRHRRPRRLGRPFESLPVRRRAIRAWSWSGAVSPRAAACSR